MVQPSPIVVCAVICQCEISLQFVPITTWGPTTQYGPIDVPSPITAPSSTRAVGSIVLIKWVQSANLLGFPVVTATYRRCLVTYGYAVFRHVGPRIGTNFLLAAARRALLPSAIPCSGPARHRRRLT